MLLDVFAITFLLIPGVHMVVRRFQDRYPSGIYFTGLFVLEAWLIGSYAAGLTPWLALPLMAVVAFASQLAYLGGNRGRRGLRRFEPRKEPTQPVAAGGLPAPQSAWCRILSRLREQGRDG
jgi:uncharacterized membrane protein YhaH (DUF805 family)